MKFCQLHKPFANSSICLSLHLRAFAWRRFARATLPPVLANGGPAARPTLAATSAVDADLAPSALLALISLPVVLSQESLERWKEGNYYQMDVGFERLGDGKRPARHSKSAQREPGAHPEKPQPPPSAVSLTTTTIHPPSNQQNSLRISMHPRSLCIYCAGDHAHTVCVHNNIANAWRLTHAHTTERWRERRQMGEDEGLANS